MALTESIRKTDREVPPDSCIRRATGRACEPDEEPGDRVTDVSRGQDDRGWTVLMAAPPACLECGGSGWRLYTVETVEGQEEWAWELCPECGGGDAFPPEEGGAV